MSTEANPIRTLFLTALEKETPAERKAYLDEACAGDDRLRRRLEAMLFAHDQPSELLDQSAAGHLADYLVGNEPREVIDILEPARKPDILGRLGHYEVREIAGRGGMGIVLKAFDEKLHRVVAIKMLAPALAAAGQARQQFVREARAAAAVAHENVVAIHAVEDGGPIPYLVMEFVGGRTLQQKLDSGGPLPVDEILRIGIQIARGLAAAHQQGIIHRDVKPSNILLENGVERVKITDFGLARAADDASMTLSGHVAGTPAYMSPEQAAGERLGPRSDLFSLGSVLYALAAGHPPFQAESSMAVLRRVCDETPKPLREVNPAVPDYLGAVVAKLHAKKPADRYSSATEVADVLSRHLARLQSGRDPSDVVPEMKPAPPQPVLPARGRRKLIWLALPVLLAGVAWGGWALTRAPDRDKAATAPADGPNATLPPPTPTPAEVPPLKPVDLRPVKTLRQHSDEVRAVMFSPTGKVLASAGKDRSIILWNTDTWTPRATLTGSPGEIFGLAFSPDGRKLASVTPASDECFVRLWDVASGKPAGTLGDASPGMWCVDWSRDGKRIACGGMDRTVTVWDVAGGDRWAAVPEVFSRFTRVLSFSPNGNLVAAGGMDGRMRVYDLAAGREVVAEFPREMYPYFLPSGDAVAGWTYEEGRVTVCDIPSGQVRALWRAHPGRIEGLSVSPDGRCLASGGSEGVATIWLTADQTEVATLTGHRGEVFAAAFSPDGTRLATGGGDATVRIWDLPPICHVRK